MSLDNIELTPILIEGLFKNSLIEMSLNPIEEKVSPKLSFNILGNNRSNVVIVIDEAEHLHLPESQLNFLTSVLNACKLTLEDVAIININKNKNITYKSISVDLKAEKVIMFGVVAEQIGLPLTFPQYQIQLYNDQTYIAAAKLLLFENDIPEKTKLWNCLKQIFIA